MVLNHQLSFKKLPCLFKKVKALNFNIKTETLYYLEFSAAFIPMAHGYLKGVRFKPTFGTNPFEFHKTILRQFIQI